MTQPNSTGPIETKVKAATAGAVVSAAAIWALDEYVFVADTVPAPIEALVVLAIAGAATFIAGYWARHTRRTDRQATQ